MVGGEKKLFILMIVGSVFVGLFISLVDYKYGFMPDFILRPLAGLGGLVVFLLIFAIIESLINWSDKE